MTAHGLGAFVGWAAFALMGFTWWVLAEFGYPIGARRPLARAAWWPMVVGVGGVVVSTLSSASPARGCSSPLPFHAAGHGATGDGVFSVSVLLVGLSIFAWCVGSSWWSPAPASARTARAQPRGVAMGLGILWPKRFVSARPVPYPVIPLDGDRHRHDHRDDAARDAAAGDDHPVVRAERVGRPAAGEEGALVVRPPGGLPAALPGGRDLLPAGAALRPAPLVPATSSPSAGRSPSSPT